LFSHFALWFVERYNVFVSLAEKHPMLAVAEGGKRVSPSRFSPGEITRRWVLWLLQLTKGKPDKGTAMAA